MVRLGILEFIIRLHYRWSFNVTRASSSQQSYAELEARITFLK